MGGGEVLLYVSHAKAEVETPRNDVSFESKEGCAWDKQTLENVFRRKS